MSAFDPQSYGPAVAAVLSPPRVMALDAGTPNPVVTERIEALAGDLTPPCVAGLWLYHDHLDRSHRLSQRLEGADADYWHGLMHRREGDHSNAKYWFRRVGAHPIHGALQAAAAEEAAATADPAMSFLTTQGEWDPGAFVDLCAEVKAGRHDCEALCRAVQQREWELLFAHCHRDPEGA